MTQSRENLVTDGTDGKTDGQTDESDFIARCLTRKIKIKSKIKLNSKYLFQLATLEINTNWTKKNFFLILPNKTECEFNNFNIDIE